MKRNKPKIVWKTIATPNMWGQEYTRADGITVQVVRCYTGEWCIFLTHKGNVVARSVEEYRTYGNGNMPYCKAVSLARTLAT